MNIRQQLLTIAFATTFTAVAHAQTDSVLYRVFDTQAEKEISLSELVGSLQHTDVLFFGEEHNDSVAHALQYDVLKAMDERYETVALSMEMLVSDDQLVLNEYLGGLITERNFSKDAVLWNNYADYRPAVEYAKAHHLKVLAANAPSRYTNRVTREGLGSLDTLDEAAKMLLAPLPIDTLTGAYYEKFNGLMGEHGSGMANMKIYQSQSLWDATMAYRISQLAKRTPAVKILHLNGRFHSDEKLGTIAQLAKYAATLRVKNISCFPHEGFDKPQWETFRHLGDYVIITNPDVKRTF
ncbi:ChaN family lipoprotein [Parapedobacter lycopersici]|uniref:ChaN family lipoprotein n=1 Tax=Parapedobacter lycopersici TaxID=1864939 RepID=UPI00214D979E|nr:ChaN family lipoprotein [Parapedobacter lycopersici]